ncbi:hypothetical protein BC629DRAFT_1577985 [Irpex lacteus]|nr:hypothetical protein BC629DRAFT_1577985 [Irpex lacteus]
MASLRRQGGRHCVCGQLVAAALPLKRHGIWIKSICIPVIDETSEIEACLNKTIEAVSLVVKGRMSETPSTCHQLFASTTPWVHPHVHRPY